MMHHGKVKGQEVFKYTSIHVFSTHMGINTIEILQQKKEECRLFHIVKHFIHLMCIVKARRVHFVMWI